MAGVLHGMCNLAQALAAPSVMQCRACQGTRPPTQEVGQPDRAFSALNISTMTRTLMLQGRVQQKQARLQTWGLAQARTRGWRDRRRAEHWNTSAQMGQQEARNTQTAKLRRRVKQGDSMKPKQLARAGAFASRQVCGRAAPDGGRVAVLEDSAVHALAGLAVLEVAQLGPGQPGAILQRVPGGEQHGRCHARLAARLGSSGKRSTWSLATLASSCANRALKRQRQSDPRMPAVPCRLPPPAQWHMPAQPTH